MVITWNVTVPELTGDAPRKAYLYLPESYDREPDKRYPVLYMFDGHNVFFDSDATYGKSWGMKEYMDYTGTQLLIAAVECNHSPDNGRLREYSPFPFDDPKLGHFPGLGRKTMEWMIGSFKKDIDSRFRTLADRENTFIGGSSMGGLMSLYAVLEFNKVFSRAAALSPSIWVAPEKLERLARRASLGPDTVVYMDYGSEEMRGRAGMLRGFGRMAALLVERRVLVTSRMVPGGQHCEASWERQIPFFMNTLLYRQ
ncbi:MAG TPA: alpha/beta hydrolase [Candidatus Enterocloster excrementipullorum]|uniref:Alpha/beta hydrolase n=1 Tax=Candidatus Enterocloster excrementipullorum TaxID=2838559 RepID=A0A9D2SG97_9FIRM|nr:alpha/beta hydrolase [Candidatus Enterocloster excrementipullorum]